MSLVLRAHVVAVVVVAVAFVVAFVVAVVVAAVVAGRRHRSARAQGPAQRERERRVPLGR